MTITSGTKLGSYEILAPLGAGGMGEVWLAEDTRLKRKVALKLLPIELTSDAERVRRFMQEAQAASALNHPNIITVHDIGESETGRFIVMELVVGRTLRAVIAEDNSIETLLSLGAQMAKAFSAAHTAGITHRDIKPDNIMVREDGYVKVLDFGLARLLHANSGDSAAATLAQQTTPGTIMGTVAYMSPEQARGEVVSHPSDVFALGIVLYELATGRHPFKAETLVGYLHAITLQTPAPPQQWQPKLPAALNDLILQMLNKEASQRPTASEVLQVLLEAEHKRPSSDYELVEARTMILPQATAAAPEFRVPPLGSVISEQNKTPLKSGTLNLNGKPKTAKWWIAALLSLLVLVGGVFGYRSFTATKQIESIAVMPFVNASGNGDVEYLSDGMTETLISSLSQLPKLNVKARSSVFRYKGKEFDLPKIALELKVQAILNGRVVQRGEQLTLSLELIDAQTENVIWSEQYNRQQTDLVTLQSEIARDVSSKLKAKLSGAEEAVLAKSHTVNPEAYQFYLKGRFQWNKRTGESLRKAIEYFHQAIEQDPRYALAYAGLADAFMVLHFHGGVAPAESYGKAKTAARQALALDETLAEAHAALAYVLFRYDWKAEEAFREFQRAIDLNPNYPTAHHWYGESLTLAGRFDQGIAALRRAQELDPLSLVINTDIGNACYYARRYDAAIEQLHKTLELDSNFAYAYFNLGLAHTMKSQYAEALTAFRRAQQLNDGPHLLANLAYCYAASGLRAEALQLVKQMHEIAAQRYVSAYSFAVAYAGLGERDQALQWLEKSYQDHSSDVTYAKTEPRFDNLRADPRFKVLLQRVNLPE